MNRKNDLQNPKTQGRVEKEKERITKAGKNKQSVAPPSPTLMISVRMALGSHTIGSKTRTYIMKLKFKLRWHREATRTLRHWHSKMYVSLLRFTLINYAPIRVKHNSH